MYRKEKKSKHFDIHHSKMERLNEIKTSYHSSVMSTSARNEFFRAMKIIASVGTRLQELTKHLRWSF